jgi:hypothetical protein
VLVEIKSILNIVRGPFLYLGILREQHEVVDWIEVVQGRKEWRAIVNTYFSSKLLPP